MIDDAITLIDSVNSKNIPIIKEKLSDVHDAIDDY